MWEVPLTTLFSLFPLLEDVLLNATECFFFWDAGISYAIEAALK
jgi:hypothetical protein